MVTVIVKVHVYCWKYHPCTNWYNMCQRLQCEIHLILCSCNIESSEKKKIAFRTTTPKYTLPQRLVLIFEIFITIDSNIEQKGVVCATSKQKSDPFHLTPLVYFMGAWGVNFHQVDLFFIINRVAVCQQH